MIRQLTATSFLLAFMYFGLMGCSGAKQLLVTGPKGKPLAGATVRLKLEAGNKRYRTNKDGVAVVKEGASDAVSVHVSKQGFHTTSIDLGTQEFPASIKLKQHPGADALLD